MSMTRGHAMFGAVKLPAAFRGPFAVALGIAIALALCASAQADPVPSGSPVKLGTPFESGQPAVAVTPAGDAVVAWANTKDLAGATDLVQYCVLPDRATACSASGSLSPADGASAIDGVQVLAEGSQIVILADVFGAQGNNATDYEPEQEWVSTDGGATFTIVNGGLSVTSAIMNADTEPIGAVTLPGSAALGYGWVTAGGAPTFNAFPLAGPPECSVATCGTPFATLEPATNPDTLSNEEGAFAGSKTGVMGAFDTEFSNGPLGCSQGGGIAYVYGSGAEGPTNDYNISPGQPNSAWRVPLTALDCDAENPAVAGGPSGFGVLESDEGHGTTVYHAFDAATQKFDATPVTLDAAHGELSGSLSQDVHGGIYATYLAGGPGGPANLSFSANGGSSFSTAAINPDHDEAMSDLASAVSSGGQGWLAWQDNGSVFAQSFLARDALSAPTVSGGATASSSGTTVDVDVSCASFPCTITVTLTAPETVIIHASAVTAAKRAKTVTLGHATFTLRSAGAKRLSIKLSAAGRRLLRDRTGHVKISAAFSETEQKHTVKFTRGLRLTIKAATKHSQ
jgi:hypothetical protein